LNFRKKHITSLKSRILYPVISLIILSYLIAGYFTYNKSYNEVTQLFNAQLEEMAETLGQIDLRQVEGQNNAQLISEHHQYHHNIIFQVWHKGKLRLKSLFANTDIITKLKGFGQTKISNKEWLTFTIHDGDTFIIVAEDVIARDKLAKKILNHIILPLTFIVPIIVFLTIVIVNWGLSFLSKIKEDLKKRNLNSLEPLNYDTVPNEIRPLVNEMNMVFSKLKKAIKRERNFISNASHELRTPLSIINIQAHNVQNSKGKDSEAINDLMTGIKRAISTVENILEFSKIDFYKDSLFQKVNLRRLVSKIIDGYKDLINQRNLSIELHGHKKTIFVRGVEELLSIAIRNLIDNSIKYSPNNSQIIINLHEEGNSVSLIIKDFGIGIEQEDQANAFYRFERKHKENIAGSGIGLSITKEILDIHSAEITLISEGRGRGAEFRVVFTM